ncbi:Na+-transporting NADH:ubiquinone oxidoreductase subunit C [Dysgonomonas alginatilytica]|uniref:Na(+)-translocating NADH-quinone reductase subunit C n=1 Tax=Dysgonomonas alginatilytica TaxID=1605892 RepID=A0A2V3PPD2_9BACT|nr:NADH:ubiquinone reductase (Na(+)-transporting) subunit C [Dysgonomonas alginatilytica]PXV65076.1 Na+-transporting NADH:ubiquinone oxidoreductase subunit C [Dysgonomonas alginatilytica]
MNRDSNKYTILFASVMVILVAVVLSIVHVSLKGIQQKNADVDKMSQILRSININTKGTESERKFKELIPDMYMIDLDGNIIPDSQQDAFNADLKVEMDKPRNERRYPVYVASLDGKILYILALRGSGLWGAMWGYIAVHEDGNTVYGADFDHESETPGLGAEVAHDWFSDEFVGKELYKGGVFKSIAIVKPGKSVSDRDYVDGISGGTITSHGIDNMLYNTLEGYSKFLENLKKN